MGALVRMHIVEVAPSLICNSWSFLSSYWPVLYAHRVSGDIQFRSSELHSQIVQQFNPCNQVQMLCFCTFIPPSHTYTNPPYLHHLRYLWKARGCLHQGPGHRPDHTRSHSKEFFEDRIASNMQYLASTNLPRLHTWLSRHFHDGEAVRNSAQGDGGLWPHSSLLQGGYFDIDVWAMSTGDYGCNLCGRCFHRRFWAGSQDTSKLQRPGVSCIGKQFHSGLCCRPWNMFVHPPRYSHSILEHIILK